MTFSSRNILALGTFVSAFFAPWWVPAVGAACLSIRWRAWESVGVGALLDVLWLPFGMFSGIPVATCTAIVMVWLFEPLRRQFLFDYDE